MPSLFLIPTNCRATFYQPVHPVGTQFSLGAGRPKPELLEVLKAASTLYRGVKQVIHPIGPYCIVVMKLPLRIFLQSAPISACFESKISARPSHRPMALQRRQWWIFRFLRIMPGSRRRFLVPVVRGRRRCFIFRRGSLPRMPDEESFEGPILQPMRIGVTCHPISEWPP